MKKSRLITCVLALSLCLTACGNTASTGSSLDVPSAPAAEASEQAAVSNVEASAVETGLVREPLKGDFYVEVDDDGVYSFENDVLMITAAGKYTLSGNLDGQIVVDAPEDAEVKLVFDGVAISCDSGAPVYIACADKVKVTAASGTENEIHDTRPMWDVELSTVDEKPETDASNADAAVYADCDLTLKGEGALKITADYWNGIHSKNDLTVRETNLDVNAVKAALKGNDSVTIESGNLNLISRQGDGIHTKNSNLSAKGNQRGTISIQGGDIAIYAACDGIDAAYNAEISGEGSLLINTDSYSDYSEEVLVPEEEADPVPTPGNFRGGFPGMGWDHKPEKPNYSCKGIKADNAILIAGMTIDIHSTDDGIHANDDVVLENEQEPEGNVIIDGGSISIESGDDGIHADNDLTFNGGDIRITDAYEGYEGCNITINGGDHWVYASDDGMNASSGEFWGGALITINGGNITVMTPTGDTDAIDSNGSIIINGGYTLVLGGNSMGGVAGSVDVDGEITVTAGTIIAVGGICETPRDSINAYVMSGLTFSAGEYTVKDENGQEILSFTLESDYQNAWICSEKLETDVTYTLYHDGEVVRDWTQTEGTLGGTGFGGFGFGPPGGGPPGGGPGGGPGGPGFGPRA